MLDYDREAARYDDTRGGLPRAEAAAEAVAALLSSAPPPRVVGGFSASRPTNLRQPGATAIGGTVLDVAGGTGLVASRLSERGFDVLVCDRSLGMLRLASARCPGRALNGDATRLPIGTGRLSAVTMVWLLHLLPDAEPVVAECARVLAPGGVLVTTVDKDAGYRAAGDDIESVLASYPPSTGAPDLVDARARVETLAGRCGLTPYAEATFVGHGQGRTPEHVARTLESRPSWLVRRVDPARVGSLMADLRALPEPDRPRQPPLYTLVGFRKVAAGAPE